VDEGPGVDGTVAPKCVRRQYRLLTAYKAAKDLYNMSFPADAAAKKRTAVSYVTLSTTRLLYNRYLLAVYVRNSSALRNILEMDKRAELPLPVNKRNECAREALVNICLVTESTAHAHDSSHARRILNPVCSYLPLIDGVSDRLSLALPATRLLESDMAALAEAMRSEEVV